MTMSITMRTDALPRPITMTGSGYENLRARTGRFKMDMSDLSDVSNGEIPANAGLEEIVAYPDVYMRSPMLKSAVPPGKWGHIDFRKSGRQIGVDFDSFMQNDPTQTLRSLRVTGEDIKRVGNETIRGVATTHYSGTIDLRKMPDLVPESKRAAAQKSVDRLIALTGASKYPMSVWIDRRSLMRRMSFTMEMKIQGQKMKMGMSMDLFDFGPKPKVKRPRAADVVELPSGAQTGP